MARGKYGALLKKQVMKEYFEGLSAKEISAKYGVKERTVYSWSRKAKDNDLVSEREEEGIKFLLDNVATDNRVNKLLEERVQYLEDEISELRKLQLN